jgi:hypothetical protein
VIDARLRAIFEEVEEPFHPESLRRFGRMVKELVGAHSWPAPPARPTAASLRANR